jgi:hypothetical protein
MNPQLHRLGPVLMIGLTAAMTAGCEQEVRTRHNYLRSQNEYQANDPARSHLPTAENPTPSSGLDQFGKDLDDFFFGWTRPPANAPHPAYKPPSGGGTTQRP